MRKTDRKNPAYGAKNRAKTHCPRGHEYTPENTYVGQGAFGPYRNCRICRRDNDRARYLRDRAAKKAIRKPSPGWNRWARNQVIPR